VVVSHLRRRDNYAPKVGHPVPIGSWYPRSQKRDLGHPAGVSEFWSYIRLDKYETDYEGRFGFVVAHPSRKNKDAARVGHPEFVDGYRRMLVWVRGIPGPQSAWDLGYPFNYIIRKVPNSSHDSRRIAKRCKWRMRRGRRCRSSLCGRICRAADRRVRRCARQSNRAAPGAGLQAGGLHDSHQRM
jgi:hypothetical protein